MPLAMKMVNGVEVEAGEADIAQFEADAAAAAAAPRYVPVPLVRARLEALGLWDDLAALLFAQAMAVPASAGLLLKVLTLTEGIDAGDAQARAVIAAVGADPDAVLAPPAAAPVDA